MLRRRINPHESLIYRLHPELLSLVATHLVTDDLVKATHVSYHWRAVLLSYPSLWSTLDFTHTERALAFLTRSKPAPVRVFLRRIPPNTSPPLELLDQPAERITTLTVNDYVSQKELLLRTVPSLRTLQFCSDHSNALSGATTLLFPALKTLFVERVDPLLFSAPCLTWFGFSTLTFRERSMDALLDFLRNCPLLEELEISHDNDFYARRSHDVVHLPHLRAYTHYTTTGFYLGLHNILSYPPSCSVTFRCGDGSYGITDAPRPFENLAFLGDIRRIKLKTTSADREDYVEGMVEVIDAAGRRVRSTRQVVLGGERWEEALMDVINPLYPGFFEDLDARFVEVLCVEELAIWFYERGDRVREALGHLEHLRTLVLSNSETEPYLEALVPAKATDADRWPCPKLDTLVIHSRYCGLFGMNTQLTLCHVARERKVAGFPLKAVSVFINWGQDLRRLRLWDSRLEELRYIGTFEFVTGDGVLDWDVDDYFLKGLDHLRRD